MTPLLKKGKLLRLELKKHGEKEKLQIRKMLIYLK
jgi:hypothetical protein